MLMIFCFNWLLGLTDQWLAQLPQIRRCPPSVTPIPLRLIAKWVYIPLVQSNYKSRKVSLGFYKTDVLNTSQRDKVQMEYWILAIFPDIEMLILASMSCTLTTCSLKHGTKRWGMPQMSPQLWSQVWTQPVNTQMSVHLSIWCSNLACDTISAKRKCLQWCCIEKRHKYQLSRSEIPS